MVIVLPDVPRRRLGISSLEVEVRVGDELARRALSVACYFSTAAAERRIAITWIQIDSTAAE